MLSNTINVSFCVGKQDRNYLSYSLKIWTFLICLHFYFIYLFHIEIYMIYSIILSSGTQHSDTHLHFLKMIHRYRIFSTQGFSLNFNIYFLLTSFFCTIDDSPKSLTAVPLIVFYLDLWLLLKFSFVFLFYQNICYHGSMCNLPCMHGSWMCFYLL